MPISHTEAALIRTMQALEAKGLLKDGGLTVAADTALAERDKIDEDAQKHQFSHTIK